MQLPFSHHLPETSFVPVLTQQLVEPEIAWIDKTRVNESDVRARAYCIRQPYESESAYSVSERRQWADKYGGTGIGRAGGSGRCASFDGVQIKGVGRTSLVTEDANWSHTSGTLTLGEAAAEAIWSGILASCLPFGAVANHAIVLTGGQFRRTYEEAPRLRQRALLMRDFVPRPAHYIRNLYFNFPGAENGLSADAATKSRAINTLPLAFDTLFGSEVQARDGVEKINHGLRIIARRYAAQVAVSFAKRIFHGALCASNIALDGSYLDFGTASAVPAYCRQARGPAYPDQWRQHNGMLNVLKDFHFHIRKYLGGDCRALIPERALTREFTEAFAYHNEIGLLAMTGVPPGFLRRYAASKRHRLYRSMRAIYRHGAHEAYSEEAPSTATGGSRPTSRRGDYDLNRILAAASNDDVEFGSAVAPLLSDSGLRADFLSSYAELRAAFRASLPLTLQAHAHAYVALQAQRLNADLGFLVRGNTEGTTPGSLYARLTDFEENPRGVGEFIDSTVASGRRILQDLHPDLPGATATQQIEALAQCPSVIMGMA